MPEVAFRNPAPNMLVAQWHLQECRIRAISFKLCRFFRSFLDFSPPARLPTVFKSQFLKIRLRLLTFLGARWPFFLRGIILCNMDSVGVSEC